MRRRPSKPAAFIGSTYNRRAKYHRHPRLQQLLQFRTSGEHGTPVPAMFDELNNPLRLQLLAGTYAQPEWVQFVDTQQRVRAKLFDLYLDGLSNSLASVNLPSFVKTYAGRVVESMAIGQPVVSWRIPAHPRTTRLFADGGQIVLFDDDDPDRLADALQALRDDPERTRAHRRGRPGQRAQAPHVGAPRVPDPRVDRHRHHAGVLGR